MAPLPLTGSNARSVAMHRTQVAYGGCWKCLHAWQRCSVSTPRLAASQNGFVHSFGTGIGRVTLLQSLSAVPSESLRGSDTRARMLARESYVKGHIGSDSRFVGARDRPFERDPERVPLADRLVVAGEGIGALVVEAHPLEGHTREHPEARQIQTDSDSDQRPPGLHRAVPPLPPLRATNRPALESNLDDATIAVPECEVRIR